jgi:hypothetical protein
MPASARGAHSHKRPSAHNLPTPPSLWKSIGPSFILLGLALGSGELLLWPYLVANYGLGLLWGALLGITFQFVLNTEVMRYTLATGESVFRGWRRLTWLIPIWFIISTFIPWSLPGFSSASSQIIGQMFPFLSHRLVAIGLLVLVGLILTLGKTLYRTMETIQRTIIMIGIPFLVILTLYLSTGTDWQQAAWGLIGRGDGWWFFPPGIGLFAFLGAFAYSGAGGNLNLAQSYYIKEKGLGMGKGTTKISSLVTGGVQKVNLDGHLFSATGANHRKWKAWWHLVNAEHFLLFWGLGLITIIILTVLARTLVFGQAHAEGIEFLYQEAGIISVRLAPWMGTVFLMISAVMLFSTQLGVLESSTRIISENILLLGYSPGKKVNLSLAFYAALWAQIGLGIVILLMGFKEPRFLLTLSAVLNGAAMMVAFPLIYWLNRHSLPAVSQTARWRVGLLFAAFVFFLVFVGLQVIG